MRRKDREITDHNRMEEFIADCHCCRIGFCDDGEVYIVPMNFGYENQDGTDVFYFHSAKEGRKIDLIGKNPNVGFELDTNYELHAAETACGYGAGFRSLIGTGTVEVVEDEEEKIHGLNALMKQSTGKDDWTFEPKMVNAVCVFKLIVKTMTCKEHL